MPNETSNFIQIYGEQEEIDNFINLHKKLIPNDNNEISSSKEEDKPYDNNLNSELVDSDIIDMVSEDLEDSEDSKYYWDFEVSIPLNKVDNEGNNEENNEGKNVFESYIIITQLREDTWGTRSGIIINHNKQKNYLSIDTPWTPCLIWFKSMIKNYPTLTFSLKYNDEFMEDFYGWAIAVNGKIIDEEEICLHRNEYLGGIDLFKKHIT